MSVFWPLKNELTPPGFPHWPYSLPALFSQLLLLCCAAPTPLQSRQAALWARCSQYILMFYKQPSQPGSWQGRHELVNTSLLEGSSVPACAPPGEARGARRKDYLLIPKPSGKGFVHTFFFLEEHKRRESPPRQPREGFTDNQEIKPSQLCTADLISCSEGAAHTCHRGRATDVTSLCERGPSHLSTAQGCAPDAGWVSHMPRLGPRVPHVWHGSKAFCSAAPAAAPGSNSSAGIQ